MSLVCVSVVPLRSSFDIFEFDALFALCDKRLKLFSYLLTMLDAIG